MHFVSFAFCFFFLTCVLVRFFFGSSPRGFVPILAVLSLVFYAWDTPEFVLLLISVAFLNYDIARRIEIYPLKNINRYCLMGIAVLVNLVPLFLLKFFVALEPLLIAAAEDGWLSAVNHAFEFIVPIGISFYLLEGLGYVADVYRLRIPPRRQFWDVLLYQSFFPKLVGGPLIPAGAFFDQMEKAKSPSLGTFFSGLYAIEQGLFAKLVLGESFAREVNVYAIPGHLSFEHGLVNLMTVWLFSCQFFCDVYGYTQIARGTATIMGFHLPENMNYPFLAESSGEYWNRWNISLTDWGRRYILTPIKEASYVCNSTVILLICMLLYGFWHGPRTVCIVWGVWHALFLIFEKRTGGTFQKNWVGRAVYYIFTQVVFLLGCFILRSETPANLMHHLTVITTGSYDLSPLSGHIWNYYFRQPIFFSGVVVLMHLRQLFREKFGLRVTVPEKVFVAGVMFYLLLTCYGKVSDFFYFRF